MADFIASARSNYFRVVDRAAFEAWLDTLPLDVSIITETDPDVPEEKVGILLNEPHGLDLYPEDRDGQERDVLKELAPHLADGETAIFMEAGAEKLRYISGLAIALQRAREEPEGYRMLKVCLSDIYDLAEKAWGGTIRTAEY